MYTMFRFKYTDVDELIQRTSNINMYTMFRLKYADVDELIERTSAAKCTQCLGSSTLMWMS